MSVGGEDAVIAAQPSEQFEGGQRQEGPPIGQGTRQSVDEARAGAGESDNASTGGTAGPGGGDGGSLINPGGVTAAGTVEGCSSNWHARGG
jgi:hypothetical protein